MRGMATTFVHGDINGVFGDILCLSHSDDCRGENGESIAMHEGMEVVAFEEDSDDVGAPCFLVVEGVVERSPDWLRCKGSKWALRMNERGARHVYDLHTLDADQGAGG